MAKENGCPEGYLLDQNTKECVQIKSEEAPKMNWKKIIIIVGIVALVGVGIWLLYPVIADLFTAA